MLPECTFCALFGSKLPVVCTGMAVTLREVLALDVLRRAGARVVAGAESLDRPVRWVHIAEIADIATLINGGELLLSTGMGLGGGGASKRRYVASIADAGACGLIVELGRVFSALPAAMVQVAAARSLPLIALERPARYIEVTEAVHRAIISRSYDLLRKATDISRDFTDLILGGAGVAEIVSRLAVVFGHPVVLENVAGNVICSAGSPADGAAGAHVSLPHSGAGRVLSGPGCLWAGISLRHEAWGRVHVLFSDEPDEIAGLVLDRAGAALGLALLAQKDEAHLIGRAGSALLADVLAGRVGSTAEFVRRARGLGSDLNSGRLAGLVISVGSSADGPDEQERQRVRLAVCDEVRRAARERSCAVLAGLDADRVLCVLSVPGSVAVAGVIDEI